MNLHKQLLKIALAFTLILGFSVQVNAAKDVKKEGWVMCKKDLCSLYALTAKTKASFQCGLKKYKGNCHCKQTPTACGKNWRGKTKYIYSCACRPTCSKSLCSLYTLTAQTKAAFKCGWKRGYKRKNCKCKPTIACGKNWRGKTKHIYDCKCK